jgi:hypothetical protein
MVFLSYSRPEQGRWTKNDTEAPPAEAFTPAIIAAMTPDEKRDDAKTSMRCVRCLSDGGSGFSFWS